MASLEDNLAQLLKASTLITSSSLLSRALSFIGHITVVRILSPSTLGNIALAHSISITIASLALFGLDSGISRLIAASGSSKEREETTVSAVALVLGIALSVSGIVFMASDSISGFFSNESLRYLLPVFSIYIFSKIVADSVIGVLRGYSESRAIALGRDILPKSGALIVLLATFLITGAEMGAITYYISVPILALVVSGFIASQVVGRTNAKPAICRIKELLQFSWPLAISSASVILMINSDLLFLGVFSNSENIGYYRSVRPVAELVLVGLSSTVVLYMPLATSMYDSQGAARVGDIFKSVTKWLSILTFPLVGIFALFPNIVITSLFGPEYQGAGIILSILSIGMFVRVLVGPNGATAQALGRPKIELYAGTISFVSNLLLNLYLVPKFGAAGAALATSVGFSIYNMIELYMIYSEFGILPFSYAQFKSIIAALIFPAIVYYPIHNSNLGLISIFFTGVVWVLFQVAVVVLTDSFTKTDYRVLAEIDHPWINKILRTFADQDHQ